MFTEILEKIIFGFVLCCINLWLLSLFIEGCNSNIYSILPCILNSTYSNYTYICCFWLLVDLVLIYGQFCLVILHLLSMPMAAVFYCPCLRERFFIVQSILPCITSSAFSVNSCYLWLCINHVQYSIIPVKAFMPGPLFKYPDNVWVDITWIGRSGNHKTSLIDFCSNWCVLVER